MGGIFMGGIFMGGVFMEGENVDIKKKGLIEFHFAIKIRRLG
jgi:hypothetical protein